VRTNHPAQTVFNPVPFIKLLSFIDTDLLKSIGDFQAADGICGQQDGFVPAVPTLTSGVLLPTSSVNSGDGSDGGDGSEYVSTSIGISTAAVVGIVIAIPIGSALVLGLVGLILASHARSRRREMLRLYMAQVPAFN